MKVGRVKRDEEAFKVDRYVRVRACVGINTYRYNEEEKREEEEDDGEKIK